VGAIPFASVESAVGAIRACTTSRGRPARRPRRTTDPNSWLLVSRAAAGSTASRSGSGGQLSAALAPAGTQNRPTGAGAHAQAEPVGPGATTVVGLEGALALAHGRSPGFRYELMQVLRCPRHLTISTGRTQRGYLCDNCRTGMPKSPAASGDTYEGTHPLPASPNRG
jgi:hypothetical protein